MILSVLAFNILLYSISAWAMQDYYWMLPLEDWDTKGLLAVVGTLNLAFIPASVVMMRTAFNSVCSVLFIAVSFFFFMGV